MSSSRLGGLHDVDPRAVPLPIGTEVVTRVDKQVGDRLVTQGAVGRVVALDEGSADGPATVDVELVGAGRARFLRDEVLPRKPGLTRYARRRHDAWEALAPTIVLDVVVGSRAWGLAGEGSDEDRRGVFVLPFDWQTGLAEPPLDLASADGTRACWEVGKAIRQAVRADPNTLELLFVAAPADVRDPMAALLLDVRLAFVSQEIYGSFGRYALSQLDRLEHNQRLADHRTILLGWLAADPTMSLDQAAARLAADARVPGVSADDALRRARDYCKQLYRSLYDQGRLPASEWSALVDLARRDDHGFELPRDLRPKNAYNLIRLLDVATRWLSGAPDEAPDLRVGDALRPTLLAIKRGEVALAEVLAMARAMTPALEAARAASRLPRQADLPRVDGALRAIRAEAARRWLAREPGP
ncbi:MAG TPA: nucleotidyltransferase domain-containing protein, partial [Kofleriaceae bacterium]|nr:nucleotidyltransferase domain-containing protein [Kofleriaceae bacterium]